MRENLACLMHDPNLILPEMQSLLSDISAQAASLDFSCYLVGGFVRDLLLGRPVNDLDIVVEGDAVKLGKILVKKIGGKLTPHAKFHTAIWHLPGTLNLSLDTLDLITARRETYQHAGALPTVNPSTIEDDLRRRDFTINAMAVRLDSDSFGELLDPVGGRADLEKGIVRVLHPRSFIDDPTRILRALRYVGRYTFSLEASTSDLINPESLAVLSQLSGERLRHELDLILAEKNPVPIISRATDLGILKYMHPALPSFNLNYLDLLDVESILDMPVDRVAMGYMFWLMDLSENEILSIAKRLEFTSDLTRSVWSVSQLKKSLPFLVNSKPSVWTYALEKLPMFSIYAVYLVTGENALFDYVSIWRHVRAHTTGDDLLKRNLTPGPRFGEILSRLRAAWLDGEVRSIEQEEDLLERLLEE